MATRIERSQRLLRIIQRLDVRIDAAMDLAGELIATEARRSIQKSRRGGRTYEKYNPRRTHVASKDWQAPATDTGELARSITTHVDYQTKIFYVISSTQIAPYNRALEFGSLGTNLYPRPFLRPALVKKQAVVFTMMSKAVNKALQDARNGTI